MSDHAPRRLVVKDVVRETADAHSIVFEGPPMEYRPGQFLTLRIPSDREPTARCYSLSSSPHVDDVMKVTVKRTVDGYASNWVCDNVRPGTELDVLPPAGKFSPKDLDADLLLLAGGSGITPVISIVKSALAQGSGRVALLYANRDEASVIFAEELRGLAAAHPERLTVVHWLESVSGIPTTAQLRELVRPYAAREAFVCGPAPFMSCVQTALSELGLERRRVHVERFMSLEGNPWEGLDEQPVAAPAAAAAPAGRTARVHVQLDGETSEHEWPQDTKLLDLLLRQGLDAPYSCRQGNCSACSCKLLDGEVRMLHNAVLEQEDLDEGWVLACQSVPVTDVVKVSYDD
ncbi:MAG TPA: ferredoxin--NADP reductase [Mycobacteriales bacterium]|nr:ferredoxin--NADP reductase [Mycobacteriales bacterium]